MNTDIAITVEYNYANLPSQLCQARTEPATMNILTLLRFQLYSSPDHQNTTDFKINLEEYFCGQNRDKAYITTYCDGLLYAIVNRPGVAGAVLHTASLLIH